MRKSLTLALLALVLVSLVTATWAGVPQATALVLSEPVEFLWLVESQPVEFAAVVAAPLSRPTATALLRGPPSSGLSPCTNWTPNQESAWPRSADSPPSSPT